MTGPAKIVQVDLSTCIWTTRQHLKIARFLRDKGIDHVSSCPSLTGNSIHTLETAELLGGDEECSVFAFRFGRW